MEIYAKRKKNRNRGKIGAYRGVKYFLAKDVCMWHT
jgi:hypothetical protein